MANIMINLDHSHHSQPPQDTQNDCINLKT